MPGDQVGTDYKLCHALEMRGFQIANSSSIIQKRRLPIPHTLMDQKCFNFPGLYVKLNHLKSSFTIFSVYLLVEHQVSKSTIHFASLSFSKQVEKHYRDGTKEIIFPDQTIKYLYPNGAEECVFSDGIIQKINVEGERTIEFPNGQRETHTKCYKVSGDTHFCLLFVLRTSNYKEERVKHPLLDSEGGMESTLGLKGSFNTFFCCEKRN